MPLGCCYPAAGSGAHCAAGASVCRIALPAHGHRRRSTQAGAQRNNDGAAVEQRKNPELFALTTEPSVASRGSATDSSSSPATAAQPRHRPEAGDGTGAAPKGPAAAADSSSRPATVTLPRQRPEVLAPAGGWAQLRAAVENGADAVYFGLSDFNARARAANFEPSELPVVMQYLHERGAKGYVVVNVLGEPVGWMGGSSEQRVTGTSPRPAPFGTQLLLAALTALLLRLNGAVVTALSSLPCLHSCSF